MTKRQRVPAAVVLFVALLTPVSAQDSPPPPKEPFKAVHVLNLKSDADLAALVAWMTEANAIVAKMGVRDTKYRLYKVAGQQAGTFAYLLESAWSGGDAYEKTHKSADFQALQNKHPKMATILSDDNQIYNRYVEVPLKK